MILIKNKLHYRSIFFKTLLTLFSSSLALLLLYNVIMFDLFNRTYERQLVGVHHSLVDRSARLLDEMLQSVAEDTNLLTQEPDTINALIIPSSENRVRNYRLFERLKDIADESPYIRDIHLYLPLTELLFSSRYGVISAPDAAAVDLPQLRDEGETGSTERWFSHEKELLYRKDFPLGGAWTMGRVLVELDTGNIYASLNDQLEPEREAAFITDASGDVIVGPEAAGANWRHESWSNQETGHYVWENDGAQQHFFYASSRLSPWKTVIVVSNDALSFFANISLATMLPMVVVLLVLSLVLSSALSSSFYNPIEHLMRYMIEKYEKTEPGMLRGSRNGYELISKGYYEAVEKEERLAELLERSVPMIKDDLFSFVLREKAPDKAEFGFFAQYFDIEPYLGASYLVLVLRMAKQDDAEIGDVFFQRNLGLLDVRDEILRMTGGAETHLTLSMDRSEIVAVFRLSSGDEEASEMLKSLRRETEALVRKRQPETISVAMSNVWNNLEAVRDAYQEALMALQYQTYLGKVGVISAGEIGITARDDDADDNSAESQYAAEIQKTIAAIAEMSSETLSAALLHLFAWAKLRGGESAAPLYLAFVDEIKRFLITNNMEPAEIFDDQASAEEPATWADLQYKVTQVCQKAMDMFKRKNAGRQYAYVREAQSYILSNYANSSLSLNEVADYIDLSPSYLSRLFKQEYNEGLADYINRIRVEKAKELLDNTKITVKEVGFAVGFNTIHNFIRIFKRYTDTTPGKYSDARK